MIKSTWIRIFYLEAPIAFLLAITQACWDLVSCYDWYAGFSDENCQTFNVWQQSHLCGDRRESRGRNVGIHILGKQQMNHQWRQDKPVSVSNSRPYRWYRHCQFECVAMKVKKNKPTVSLNMTSPSFFWVFCFDAKKGRWAREPPIWCTPCCMICNHIGYRHCLQY